MPTAIDKEFYRQEKLEWRGVWNIPITADCAADLANRLLAAVGEHHISVRVMVGAEWHEAYQDRIDFIANEITTQTVIHEVAHVIQIRNDGVYSPDHCENLWMTMGLLQCVLEECL